MTSIFEAPSLDTPSGQILSHFMQWKGIEDFRCIDMEKADGFVWYYLFEVEDQRVEVCVEYVVDAEKWDVEVTRVT